MSRKQPNRTAETLRELEATGDRFADWASDNAALILGVIAGILVLAAGIGLWAQHRSSERDAAADSLALATSGYRRAMGADPAGGPIPEPANPELAERTRTEYAERFATLGGEHAGTAAGAVAWLEAGTLQIELGQPEAAIESFENARRDAGESAIAALAANRLAGLAESRDDMAAAAGFYEEAASIEAYPLRATALTDAARCWALAGETDRALAALQRVEAEYPDELIAPQIESLLAELQVNAAP